MFFFLKRLKIVKVTKNEFATIREKDVGCVQAATDRTFEQHIGRHANEGRGEVVQAATRKSIRLFRKHRKHTWPQRLRLILHADSLDLKKFIK